MTGGSELERGLFAARTVICDNRRLGSPGTYPGKALSFMGDEPLTLEGRVSL